MDYNATLLSGELLVHTSIDVFKSISVANQFWEFKNAINGHIIGI